MPTEFFSLAEVEPSYTGQVTNERTTSERAGHSLGAWRTALQAGGWTEYGSVYASLTVSLSLVALPVRTPDAPEKLPGILVCQGAPAIIVTFPGGDITRIWGYDPGKYEEPPCSAFGYGFTPGDTFEIFKGRLSGAMGMGISGVTVDGDLAYITLQSPLPGPGHNGTRVSGWVAGTVWGGGYDLRSGAYRGHFLSVTGREGAGFGDGKHHAWEMTARVHLNGSLTGGPGQRFDLWLDPARSSPYEWRICVCPYQFAIWMDGYGDEQATGTPYPRSAVVSMPWVPEDYHGHDAFAFVATGILGNIRGKLTWEGSTWYDAGPWSEPSIRTMIVPVLRTDGGRLTTTQGMVVADNAWVLTRRTGTGSVIENRISGKLWNCCVLGDDYEPSTIYAEGMLPDAGGDGTWVQVSSVTAPQKASLWWKVTTGDLFPPEA